MLRKLALANHSGEIKCPSEIRRRSVTETFFGDDALLSSSSAAREISSAQPLCTLKGNKPRPVSRPPLRTRGLCAASEGKSCFVEEGGPERCCKPRGGPPGCEPVFSPCSRSLQSFRVTK